MKGNQPVGLEMKQLQIVWKRLVKSGETCDRCGRTEVGLEGAFAKLRAALSPLGIEPVVIKQEMDSCTFEGEPSESNRIWIAGKPLEDWLEAKVGMSKCCSACGDSDCRTVEVAGKVYEAIPDDLIARAGLLAAAQMLRSDASEQTANACCGQTKCC